MNKKKLDITRITSSKVPKTALIIVSLTAFVPIMYFGMKGYEWLPSTKVKNLDRSYKKLTLPKGLKLTSGDECSTGDWLDNPTISCHYEYSVGDINRVDLYNSFKQSFEQQGMKITENKQPLSTFMRSPDGTEKGEHKDVFVYHSFWTGKPGMSIFVDITDSENLKPEQQSYEMSLNELVSKMTSTSVDKVKINISRDY